MGSAKEWSSWAWRVQLVPEPQRALLDAEHAAMALSIEPNLTRDDDAVSDELAVAIDLDGIAGFHLRSGMRPIGGPGDGGGCTTVVGGVLGLGGRPAMWGTLTGAGGKLTCRPPVGVHEKIGVGCLIAI
jgi:hypothetical protein